MKITIQPAQPVPIESVTLVLTPYEAGVLHRVCGRLTGPYDGPRKVTREIWDALDEAGVKPVGRMIDAPWIR
jgi:hypothetical protein